MQIINPVEKETHPGDVATRKPIYRAFEAQMMELALQMCFGEYGADAVLIYPLVGNTAHVHRSGSDSRIRRELSGSRFGTDNWAVYRRIRRLDRRQ